jgi:hypothetical protein
LEGILDGVFEKMDVLEKMAFDVNFEVNEGVSECEPLQSMKGNWV